MSGSVPSIAKMHGRQILDSRGRPTVEVDVHLDDGRMARASVPSGASTGTYEAHERRDGDHSQYAGLGVRQAARAVSTEIDTALHGRPVTDQQEIDTLLRDLDGSPALTRIGANAILGASLAVCRAGAVATGQPLYRYIAELAGTTPALPTPVVNILSGGVHAGRGMDVQDFLAVPAASTSFPDALHIIARVRAAAADVLTARGLPTLLADEGGLSPGCATGEEALDLMVAAIEAAGLRPGRDVLIALDVAAHTLVTPDGDYAFAREGVTRSSAETVALLERWVDRYPVVSIEDGLDEEDWSGWTTLTGHLGGRVQVVGDDLFTTNAERLRKGVSLGAANSILIKLNQNGTLTGTLDVVRAARAAGYAPMVSARSGETEDDFLADLAVGVGAGQIKIGSLRCSDRLAKYNQLVRIAEDDSVPFAPWSPASTS
ncbi:phosphopyruvate hydratase [Prauserella muralis]|uniref:Enolase n=1 Tax=Prauserella muralis TaxID=588067 RepID=A0A2V4AG73_9PSEU|nr:phosphopyruvate hydratase [Prauserella muralis]PXY18935.1 phosphopyruvate hydratase [Prauserella muralis]TWE28815.1 enolase [Prauserella muralis]